jgi:hypothetical protein
MPITPLRFGALPPVADIFPGNVSLTSFGLVNAGIDMQFLDAVITGQPLPTHGDYMLSLVC